MSEEGKVRASRDFDTPAKTAGVGAHGRVEYLIIVEQDALATLPGTGYQVTETPIAVDRRPEGARP